MMALSISDVDMMVKDVKTAEDMRLFGKVYKAAKWASLTQDEKVKELARLENEEKERLILEQKMKEFDDTAKKAAKAKKEAKALAIKQEAENKKKMKYYAPDGTITQNGVVIDKLEVEPAPKVVEVPKIVVARAFLDELNKNLENSLNKIANLKSTVAELTNTIYDKDKQIEEVKDYYAKSYVLLQDAKKVAISENKTLTKENKELVEENKKFRLAGNRVTKERDLALDQLNVSVAEIKDLENQIEVLTKALEVANSRPKQAVIAPVQQVEETTNNVIISAEILKEQQERLNSWVQDAILEDKIKIRIGQNVDNRQFVIRRGHKKADGTITVNDFMVQKLGVTKFFDIIITSWVSGDFEGNYLSGKEKEVVAGINHFGWVSVNNEETIYPLTFNLIDQETGNVYEATSLSLPWMDSLEEQNYSRFGYYFINGKGLFSIDIIAGGTRLTNVGQASANTCKYSGRMATGKRVLVLYISHKAFDEYHNKGLYVNLPKLKLEESL